MRFLPTAVTKDLRRVTARSVVAGHFARNSLVLVTLITLVFSGGQATPQGRLLVADEDKTR